MLCVYESSCLFSLIASANGPIKTLILAHTEGIAGVCLSGVYGPDGAHRGNLEVSNIEVYIYV